MFFLKYYLNKFTWKLLPCGKIKYLLGRDKILGAISITVVFSSMIVELVQRIKQFKYPIRKENR